MSAPVYTTKRARFWVEPYGTGELRDIRIVDEAKYSFNEETIKKKSTNEVIGTVAVATISTEGTAAITMGSTEYDNFVLATRSRASTQAAVSAGTFAYPALEAGQAFKLPHENITSMSVTGKVEGVDYKLYRSSGICTLLNDNTTEIDGGTYSSGQTLQAGIAAADAQYFTLHIADELNKEYTKLYRARPLLPEDVSLITPDEFGTLTVNFELLLDDSKPSDGALGQFGSKSYSM